jgi:hypothetical protein
MPSIRSSVLEIGGLTVLFVIGYKLFILLRIKFSDSIVLQHNKIIVMQQWKSVSFPLLVTARRPEDIANLVFSSYYSAVKIWNNFPLKFAVLHIVSHFVS